MAWFKKKRSPIDRRLSELDQQIAALQAQLRQQQNEELRRAEQQTAPTSSEGQQPEVAPAKPQPGPRFRTTVRPGNVSPIHGIEPHEVDFFARKDKPVDFSLDAGSAPAKHSEAPPSHAEGTPSQSSQMVHKIIALFAKPKPPASQPQARLPDLLTTGSFQRLKPLRYEKRVARNRIIILAFILIVIAFLLVKCVTR